MKKLLTILVLLLMAGVAYAAVPPSANVYLSYEGSEIPDEQFNAEFLSCEAEDYDPARDEHAQQTIPELNINEYDEEKDCYWKPFKHIRWGICAASRCDFFPIDYGTVRMAIYIPSLDQVFITDDIKSDTGRNDYLVELSSDGSAVISKTGRIDMEQLYAFFEGEDYEPPKKTEMPAWIYIVILAIFIGVGWMIGTKVFGKKKK